MINYRDISKKLISGTFTSDSDMVTDGLIRHKELPSTFCSDSLSSKHPTLRPWSSWTANSDKKLNVNKPCVTS